MRSRCCAATLAAGLIALAIPAFSAAVRDPTGSGANTLPANDDGSTAAVPLSFTVNFFGANTSTVFVNNNGNVTFTSALSQFTPNGLATGVGQPIIAPYFADVDTRGTGSGLVTYGEGTITDASLGWNSSPVFSVEWPAVGYYFEHTDKIATFELLLVGRPDTGAGNFDIEFNYNTVQWETGDASGGTDGLGGVSAAVGYSNGLSGSSNVFFQLPGSLVNGALINGGADALITHDLNSTVAGRYDFEVRNGVVVNMPEPGTTILLATGGLALIVLRRRRRA
ncbi:MAG TPA: nidogen-like domain-containing protein [Candidatus Acidoferrales bacterium]|nr:nidogen-like domain-containing protein [Candidatus Acidoferrales bacterium]